MLVKWPHGVYRCHILRVKCKNFDFDDWYSAVSGLYTRPNTTMTSQWARWRLKSPASPLFTQPFIRAQIKENIKVPRHWPLVPGEFPAQMASDAENASIWWRHHEIGKMPCRQSNMMKDHRSESIMLDLHKNYRIRWHSTYIMEKYSWEYDFLQKTWWIYVI